jgi:hypothetical protein
MPQPKSSSSSSRSSSARSAAAKKAAATRKANANKRTASAKKGTASRKASQSSSSARSAASSSAKAASAGSEAAQANVTALRAALRRGVVVTTASLREVMDDAVKRGQITRKDATELTKSIVNNGRAQADGFRAGIEQLLGKGTARAAAEGDAVLRAGDRARRAVGVGPSFPITGYDRLSASAIQKRLNDMTPAELRKVRDYEKRNDARKGILDTIDRKLKK